MSEFDPLYWRSPKLPKSLKVENFAEEDFNAGKPAGKPASGPAFEDFAVNRQTISEMLADAPSLEGLFTPFDLGADGRPARDFKDLSESGEEKSYAFEDLDTRDPEVVRTLAQAEEKGRSLLAEAEEQLSLARAAGETALKSLTAQAEGQAGAIVEKARLAAAELLKEAEEANRQALAAHTQAQAVQEETLALRAEAAEKLRLHEEETARAAAQMEAAREELRAGQAGAVEEGRREGRAEGLAQGLAEGRAKGEAEARTAFQNQVAGLLSALEKVEGLYEDLWRANGPMMIKLAIEAAEQILNKELKEAEDLAARAFSACVAYLAQAHKVTFLARPQDLAQLEQARARERERLGGLVKIEFKPDESLGPGDLIMESDVGRLDATIRNRAEKVLAVLRAAFEDGLAAPEAFSPAAGEEAPAENAPAPADETPEPSPGTGKSTK